MADHPVARMEPQVPPGCERFNRPPEIALGKGERLIGPQEQFARRAIGQGIVISISDACREAGRETSHAVGNAFLGCPANDKIALGRAKAVCQFHAGALPQHIMQAGWHSRPNATRMRWFFSAAEGGWARRMGTMAPSR